MEESGCRVVCMYGIIVPNVRDYSVFLSTRFPEDFDLPKEMLTKKTSQAHIQREFFGGFGEYTMKGSTTELRICHVGRVEATRNAHDWVSNAPRYKDKEYGGQCLSRRSGVSPQESTPPNGGAARTDEQEETGGASRGRRRKGERLGFVVLYHTL